MLDILTPLWRVNRREFQVDSSYVDPTDANAFEQGMWFTLDTANANHVIPANGELAFPIWSKRGEGTTQALQQVTVLFGGAFEADTDQFDPAQVYTIGLALETANGVLTPNVAGQVVAYVMLPPDQNGNLIRFVSAL